MFSFSFMFIRKNKKSSFRKLTSGVKTNDQKNHKGIAKIYLGIFSSIVLYFISLWNDAEMMACIDQFTSFLALNLYNEPRYIIMEILLINFLNFIFSLQYLCNEAQLVLSSLIRYSVFDPIPKITRIVWCEVTLV